MNLRRVTLDHLAAPHKGAFSTGPFGSSVSSRNFVSTGIPMIRGGNLSEDVGIKLADDDLVFLSEEVASKFARSTVVAGDLIFTCWGTVGQVGLIDSSTAFDSYIISNKQMKMSPDLRKVDPLFLYYHLSQPSLVEFVKSQAIGSSVPGFNLGQLRGIEVLIPDLPTQRRIAELLGALDNKIAACRAIARSARELALSFFAAIPRSQTSDARLSDVLTFEYGRALPATRRAGGHVSVVGSGGIVGSHDSTWLSGPGIVVGRKGSVGTLHWLDSDYFPIDTTYYVQPRSKLIPLVFCFHLLRSIDFASLNSDSAVPGLNRSEAHALPVRLPHSGQLVAASRRAETLFSLTHANKNEAATLSSLRDTLLPHLMSGRIRVGDAEKQVEEVV